ncbi:AP-4 complex subunit epsilon-1-like isoform X1 [Neocloeon triangulifer]|uniref:AP-4 complex subunit epsilon-1-like isoform X1 n=1 Tax=Neocloeon triangulifer TaxID=2078957 RepID=UPI00286EFE89|nr:AP-4 complex subunit epsilon-1-like isoform X1 [Neocloeon triangulifer]
MMSNILEKTLGSVFTGSNTDQFAGLKSLYQKCLSARTKKEENQIIRELLATVKLRLSNPSTRPLLAGHCLAFAIFAELMGFNVEFAHIHAINLAQQSSIVEKKMGYVACCCLLNETNELNLLLVNTLVRDLASKNVAIVGLALCALCSAPLPTEVIPSILPAVLDRLNHSTAYIRCRAVIAVHHILRRHPEHCEQMVCKVVALLGDSDPHVVHRALGCLPDIIQKYPELVAGLVQPLVAIQRQILNGKLPAQLNYRGIPAPWMQMSILKCLPELCLTEEEEFACKEVLLETIKIISTKNIAISEPPIRSAIIAQALTVLLSLEETNEASRIRIMNYIGLMLQSENCDVKNEGLLLLENALVKYQMTLTEEQNSVVKSSLDHPDLSIKRRCLGLLTAGATENDVQSVCGQLFTHAAKSEDESLKHWLLEQALLLLDRFESAVSEDWKLSALIKLMPLAEDTKINENIYKRARGILVKGTLKDETWSKMLAVLTTHGEAKSAPTNLLMLYIWTLGNLPHLCSAGTQEALTKIIVLGNKLLNNAKSEPSARDLLLQILCSIRKISEKEDFTKPDNLDDFLKEVSELSAVHLVEASDLLKTLENLEKIRKCLQLEYEFDFSLSALDNFLLESIQTGNKKVYQPHVAMLVLQPKPIRSPELAHLLPVELPSIVMQTSHDSAKASMESSSSKSSQVAEPTSPNQAPATLWTKEGRIKNTSEEQTTLADSDPLTNALGLSQQISKNAQNAEPEDPLGDLLR